jgi:hypothetical protein
MKNSTDTIGNRTRDLPACSAVPQPTAPPRVPILVLDTLHHILVRCIRYIWTCNTGSDGRTDGRTSHNVTTTAVCFRVADIDPSSGVAVIEFLFCQQTSSFPQFLVVAPPLPPPAPRTFDVCCVIPLIFTLRLACT